MVHPAVPQVNTRHTSAHSRYHFVINRIQPTCHFIHVQDSITLPAEQDHFITHTYARDSLDIDDDMVHTYAADDRCPQAAYQDLPTVGKPSRVTVGVPYGECAQ